MSGKRRSKRENNNQEITEHFLRSAVSRGNLASTQCSIENSEQQSACAKVKGIEANSVDMSGLQQMEERLLDAIKGIESTMDTRLNEFDIRFSSFQKVIAENTKKVQDLEESVNYAHKELTYLKTYKEQAEKESKRLKERLDEAGKKNSRLEKELDQTKADVNDRFHLVERRSREYSVRIKGMNIDKQQSFIQQAAEIFVKNELLENCTEEEMIRNIEIAHLLKSNPDEHMIVRFHSRPIRQKIVHAAKGKVNRKTTEKGLKLLRT